MKKLLILTASVTLLGLVASAGTPAYKTKSANGNAAAPASVIFPADPSLQIRLVSANWNSDTNNSVLSFTSGSTAYSIQETNQATSSITNKINSTNGLAGGAALVLQHAGICYYSTIASWNSSTNSGPGGGTNVVLAAGGWGVATTKGDSAYLMDTAVTVPVGATTNAMNGEAIYVANLSGRPVRVQLTPALATNKLNAVTARYE